MPKEPMVMSIDEIKTAMLNPDTIKHFYRFYVSNRWGEINGRQLLLDIYRLCEKHEEVLKELEDYKRK